MFDELRKLLDISENYLDGKMTAIDNKMATLKAVSDVVKERGRQIEKEGWSHEHDDQYWSGELAKAASCYAAFASLSDEKLEEAKNIVPESWPWAPEWWKPKSRQDALTKSGALILAEKERLAREEEEKED